MTSGIMWFSNLFCVLKQFMGVTNMCYSELNILCSLGSFLIYKSKLEIKNGFLLFSVDDI